MYRVRERAPQLTVLSSAHHLKHSNIEYIFRDIPDHNLYAIAGMTSQRLFEWRRQLVICQNLIVRRWGCTSYTVDGIAYPIGPFGGRQHCHAAITIGAGMRT